MFVVIALGIAGQQASAQSENSRYFSETGHWVRDEFLVMYESIPHPTLLYGAPISTAFEDDLGTKVQYFEKVRFELDPSLPPNIQVKLSPLGEYLYEEGRKLSVASTSPACRYYNKTGYAVCYAFLDFFESNGGINQFGYPISGFEDFDGRIVQHFQKARLEWHPEYDTGQRVTVGNLGLPYFYKRGEDPKELNTEPNFESIHETALRLRTRAFVSSSVLASGGTQTIYVIVQDQNFNPVSGAEVEFVVILPDGSNKEYRTSNTNEAGISTLNFSIESDSSGIANISVFTFYNKLEGQTRTSFHIWW